MIVNLELYHAGAIRYQEQFEVQGKSVYYRDHTLIYKNIRILIEKLYREEFIFHILACYLVDFRVSNHASIDLTENTKTKHVENYIDEYVHNKIKSYGATYGCIPR